MKGETFKCPNCENHTAARVFGGKHGWRCGACNAAGGFLRNGDTFIAERPAQPKEETE